MPPKLVLSHAWGEFTTEQVYRICKLARQDAEEGADTELRDSIASIKPNCKNMLRDYLSKLPPNRLPEIAYHRIPVRHKLVGRGRPELPFLYPHALFSHIYHHYPGAWSQVIAPTGEIQRFWEEVQGGTRAKNTTGYISERLT